MKILNLALIFLVILFISCGESKKVTVNNEVNKVDYALVIHGGAGILERENMSEEKEANYRAALNKALTIGETVLKNNGTSMQAVKEVIMFLENSPLFNAGKGAVFTNQETNELDASIMRGSNLQAGAVGGISTVKNPITAAIAVLENSEHVLLVGKGAEEFAALQNLELIDDPDYFKTESRYKSLLNAKLKETSSLKIVKDVDEKFGTVGCVALDRNGDIVAGTSTGGMTNKRFNRIGDSPIIGAGTYANNKTCGVSCTGHGEYFIRYAVAHDVSAMMDYKGSSLEEASNYIVKTKLKDAGGSGGLIALDAHGNISMPFNTKGMYRGYIKPDERYVGIFDNE